MDVWSQFRRYLILGTTSSYYHVHTQNYGGIHDCIRVLVEQGREGRMMDEIIRVIENHVGVSDKYAIRALAWILHYAPHARSVILWDMLPQVCQSWSSLIEFVHFMPHSWGRGVRRAVENWLHRFSAEDLAIQMMKRRQKRNRITPHNLLRLAHPRPLTLEHIELFSYIARNGCERESKYLYLRDLDVVRHRCDVEEAIQAVKANGFTWEHIGDGDLLFEGSIWNAIIETSWSLREVLQNLHRMIGVNGVDMNLVKMRMSDHGLMCQEHIQPFEVILARHMLAENNALDSVLDGAFYATFDGLQTTSKRYLLALDVSGSMACSPCIGASQISAREASAVLAMCFVRSEPFVHTLAFSDNFRYLPIHRQSALPEVLGHISHLSFDDTDCSALIMHAHDHNIVVDCFVVITDNDLTHRIRPCEALRAYQSKLNANAKMVVISTSSSEVYVAPRKDQYMLDIAGMDANVFPIIQRFALGCL